MAPGYLAQASRERSVDSASPGDLDRAGAGILYADGSALDVVQIGYT